jgi:hypothetical protein
MTSLKDTVNALWDTYAEHSDYDGRLTPESIISAQLNIPKRKVIDMRRGYARAVKEPDGFASIRIVDRSRGKGFCSTQCTYMDVSLSVI